jgi:hypothetical protein
MKLFPKVSWPSFLKPRLAEKITKNLGAWAKRLVLKAFFSPRFGAKIGGKKREKNWAKGKKRTTFGFFWAAARKNLKIGQEMPCPTTNCSAAKICGKTCPANN